MAESGSNVFVYTDGAEVPNKVTHIQVHSSVTVLPEGVFGNRKLYSSRCHTYTLKEVELCDGLLQIEDNAFRNCKALKRITIPSTVKRIGKEVFRDCDHLEEVNLSEGLEEIGEHTFFSCNKLRVVSKIPSTVITLEMGIFGSCHNLERLDILCEDLQELPPYIFHSCVSLKQINIPSSVKKIGRGAFNCIGTGSSMEGVLSLPDSVEHIGENGLSGCAFVNFKVPPLVTTISEGLFSSRCLFSIELPENLSRIEAGSSFSSCYALRNIAIPSDTEVLLHPAGWSSAFNNCTDLYQLFPNQQNGFTYSETHIVDALKHRFDNLPIHKFLYYQSYNNVTSDQLNNVVTDADPTGSQQDFLGMTPLHILACSTVQNVGLYKVLVAKYPGSLVVEDRWGALPLFYAMWGNAPDEIVQFLVESYKSLYPKHDLKWTCMVKTLSLANAPYNVIQKILDLRQVSFPSQSIDWDEIIRRLAQDTWYEPTNYEYDDTPDGVKDSPAASDETFRFIAKCSIMDRVNAIGLRKLRDEISNMVMAKIQSRPYHRFNREEFMAKIQSKVTECEAEYNTLKDATSVLELALWKTKLNSSQEEDKKMGCSKKAKIEESDLRKQCRTHCGASIIIGHVLPYLLPNKKFKIVRGGVEALRKYVEEIEG